MQRRTILETGATALATYGAALATAPIAGFIGPLTIGESDALTPLATAPNIDTETFGTDANPSFVLAYDPAEENARADIQEWVNGTDSGRIHRDLESVGMMVVSLSWKEAGRRSVLGLREFSGGLEEIGLLEFADANARLSLPEPIQPGNLDGADDVRWNLGWNRLEVAIRQGSTNPVPDHSDLAFDEDAPRTTLQEARNLVRASDATINAVDTSSVTVAVIDTGVDDRSIFDDADGNSRLLDASTDFTSSGDPAIADEGTAAVADGNGHGSWVAACTAAANADTAYQGFAPDARILAAKSLDDDGSGSVGDIVAGVDLAIERGADVACLSLGSPQWSEALTDALTRAYEEDVFCAVATGNDRYATTFVASPASSERGFGVNATNVPESGDRDDTKIAYFGNVGPHPGTQDFSEGASEGAKPALAAPGMNIEIEPVGTLTGTSMAAPMVAGAAAVLRADDPSLSVEETWERITECAYPIPMAGETETAHGLLDLEAALANDPYEETQANVRSDKAHARDEFNEALAASRGGLLAGLF